MTVAEGAILWQPSSEKMQSSALAHYMRWLAKTRGLAFEDYDSLWRWSVSDLEAFWASIWDFFAVEASTPYTRVLGDRRMPGAQWFAGARLNFAEHAFRFASATEAAIVARSESRAAYDVSWAELSRQTGAIAAALRASGVRPGDRVVSCLPNIPETISAFLATASSGAVWSSCSPDMGAAVVVDRFRQIEPKVLFAVDGYRYGGKMYDRRAVVGEIVRALPSLERVVFLPFLDPGSRLEDVPRVVTFEEFTAQDAPLEFEHVDFNHPLWIVYSSGTTGLPKAIVHGHGGILLEYLKSVVLQKDIKPSDRLFWVSSTGWIVWNLLPGSLLCGCTLVSFDGNPAWPDVSTVWRLLGETRTTQFGCGAALIAASMKAGIVPREIADLSALRGINVTGSPLSVDGFEWLYHNVGENIRVASVSGGTDIASGFVAGSPLLPVTAGEIQCRCLGVAVEALDEQGQVLVDEVGELVVSEPMPSMPIRFWNDPDDKRYRESYFDMYPGKWRHGDWIRFTDRGTCVIYGRSDTTINRHGIRMGTAEIYRVIEELPEIMDSLVVDLEYLGRPSFLPLFVVLRAGQKLDTSLKERIRERVRTLASGRHVPDAIYAIIEVPRTLTGKKMELPVRKLLLGAPVEKVASPESMVNPGSLGFFIEFAERWKSGNLQAE